MVRRRHISGLLLAAFAVWLLHFMVPHHHHGTEICFNQHHGFEQECSQCCTNESACHSHNHSGQEDGCLLKQLTFLPSHQNRLAGQPENSNSEIPGLLVFLLPELEVTGIHAVWQKWKHHSGATPPLTIRFYSTCSLRAPPAV